METDDRPEMTIAEWEAAGRPVGIVILATYSEMVAAGIAVARPVPMGTVTDYGEQ